MMKKTGDYEQQQNCQEVIDEENKEEAEALSTSGIKATSYCTYQKYTFNYYGASRNEKV